MNKLTTTLAGLALVAGASIAPAFAQGAFSGPVNFTFTAPTTPNSFSVINQFVSYNPFGTATTSTGFLTLTGGTEIDSSVVYSNTLLSFSATSGGPVLFTDTIPLTTVVPTGGGNFSIASVGATSKGDQYNLTTPAAVPEASTVLSFGALLALGGLAVLRRKSVVSNAA